MSQNAQIPLSVLVWRLFLVFLLVLVVSLDFIFEIRKGLSAAIEAWLWPATDSAAEGDMHQALCFALGMAVWLATYGSLYLTFHYAIRRKGERCIRRLSSMLAAQEANMERIRAERLADLLGWARAYVRLSNPFHPIITGRSA